MLPSSQQVGVWYKSVQKYRQGTEKTSPSGKALSDKGSGSGQTPENGGAATTEKHL
jgi:hypothetical protein